MPAEQRRLFREMLKSKLPYYAAPDNVMFEAGRIRFQGAVPPEPELERLPTYTPATNGADDDATGGPAARPVGSSANAAPSGNGDAPAAPQTSGRDAAMDATDATDDDGAPQHTAKNWDALLAEHKDALQAASDEEAPRKRVVDEEWAGSSGSDDAAQAPPSDAAAQSPPSAGTSDVESVLARLRGARRQQEGGDGDATDGGDDGVNPLLRDALEWARHNQDNGATGSDGGDSSGRRRLLGFVTSDDSVSRQASMARLRASDKHMAAKVRRAVAAHRVGTRESSWSKSEVRTWWLCVGAAAALAHHCLRALTGGCASTGFRTSMVGRAGAWVFLCVVACAQRRDA